MCENITTTNTTTPPHHTLSDQPLLRFLIEGIGIPIVGGIGVVGQFTLGLYPTFQPPIIATTIMSLDDDLYFRERFLSLHFHQTKLRPEENLQRTHHLLAGLGSCLHHLREGTFL